eukprot:UN03507
MFWHSIFISCAFAISMGNTIWFDDIPLLYHPLSYVLPFAYYEVLTCIIIGDIFFYFMTTQLKNKLPKLDIETKRGYT